MLVHDWASLINHYGYWALFVLSLFEGPLVTVFAAALAAQGLLNVAVIYGVVVAGDLVGDLGFYVAGRWLLGPWARHGGMRRHRFADRIAALRDKLHAQAGRILLFGKLTHSAGFAILLAAGAARIRLITYVFYNLLGTLPKAALLMAIGYYYGRLYAHMGTPLKVASAVVFVLVLALALLWAQRVSAPREQIGDL